MKYILWLGPKIDKVMRLAAHISLKGVARFLHLLEIGMYVYFLFFFIFGFGIGKYPSVT